MDTFEELLKTKKADETVASVWIGHENAVQYYQRKTKRLLENWRYYWAHDPDLGLGQWPAEAVQYLLSQNRQLTQFNFIKVIVDTIAGGLAQLKYDPDIYPINDRITTLTESLKKTMYADKEQMKWDASFFNMMLHGLVAEGVIKIVIDRQFDDLGNVAFRNCLPGSVMPSPNWRTWSGWDCKRLWYDTWHDKQQLMKLAPEMADYINFQLSRKSYEYVETYGSYQGVTPYTPYEMTTNEWGSTYRMISQYDIVEEEVVNEYAPTAESIAGQEPDVYIPQDIPEMDRPEWLNKFYPSWIPEAVYSKKEKINQCYVRAIVPSIGWDRPIIKKPTEIQIGRLPFHFWAPSRANGETDAIVDSIKDPQVLINYIESLMLNKMQVEGGGGAQFVDRSAFATNAEFERFKQNRNNPSENFETRTGLLAEGKTPSIPVAKSQLSAEIFQQLNHVINVIMPHISKVTPAKRGITEGSQESGKLYQLMKAQSDEQVYTVNYSLRLLMQEVYESYFLVAADLYSAENIERKFTYNRGQDVVILNEKIRNESGQVIGIRNNVSRLRNVRHNISISERQQSPNQKLADLDNIGNFIQKLGPQAKLITTQVIGEATKLMHVFPEDQVDVRDFLINKEMEAQISDVNLKIAQAQLQTFQAQQQLKQLMMAAKQQEDQIAAAQAGGGQGQLPGTGGQPQLPGPGLQGGAPGSQPIGTPQGGMVPEAQGPVPQQGGPEEPKAPDINQIKSAEQHIKIAKAAAKLDELKNAPQGQGEQKQ